MSVEASAPIPVTIPEVSVSFGGEIKFDDVIIVLEAMKMNNPIQKKETKELCCYLAAVHVPVRFISQEIFK